MRDKLPPTRCTRQSITQHRSLHVDDTSARAHPYRHRLSFAKSHCDRRPAPEMQNRSHGVHAFSIDETIPALDEPGVQWQCTTSDSVRTHIMSMIQSADNLRILSVHPHQRLFRLHPLAHEAFPRQNFQSCLQQLPSLSFEHRARVVNPSALGRGSWFYRGGLSLPPPTCRNFECPLAAVNALLSDIKEI